MKRSDGRILTTHAGSLPRPGELLELYKSGAPSDTLEPALKSAVADVVDRQIETGIDIVNDGEFGKPMTDAVDYAAWVTYMYPRLTGYEMRDVPVSSFALGKDQKDFADFYKHDTDGLFAGEEPTLKMGVNVAPVTYAGYDAVGRDIANLKSAVEGKPVSDAIMMAVTPEFILEVGEHYETLEDEVTAVAEALREEYRTIVDAGLNVQIDDPQFVDLYELKYSETDDVKGFRKWAEAHVERINHALEGIPPEHVRFHLCWGSWTGPHSSDLPIKDALDLMLKINASQFSFEAANAQHEHEWRVWEGVKLPDGVSLVPGVVSHKTNILEHPELVAQRLERYARAVGRENVIAGTDCGLGGRIHSQLAWAKLKSLTDGAALATERLWR